MKRLITLFVFLCAIHFVHAEYDEDVFKAKVECPKNFTLNGSVCEHLTEKSSLLKCPPKTVLKNNSCVGEIKVQAMLTCLENQQLVDGKCIYEEVTKPATVCAKDYVYNGKECIRSETLKTRPQCPTGYKLSILKDSCVQEIKEKAYKICPEGSDTVGNEKCSKMEIVPPVSSCAKGFDFEDGKCISYDVARANLKCADGHKYEWGRCRSVTRIPKNSVCPLDYEFDGKKCVKVFVEKVSYTCDEGFILKKNKCIKLLEHEPKKVCRSQGYRLVENIHSGPIDLRTKKITQKKIKNIFEERQNEMKERRLENDFQKEYRYLSEYEPFEHTDIRFLSEPVQVFPYEDIYLYRPQGSFRDDVIGISTIRNENSPNVSTYNSNRRASTIIESVANNVDNAMENMFENVTQMGEVIKPVSSAFGFEKLPPISAQLKVPSLSSLTEPLSSSLSTFTQPLVQFAPASLATLTQPFTSFAHPFSSALVSPATTLSSLSTMINQFPPSFNLKNVHDSLLSGQELEEGEEMLNGQSALEPAAIDTNRIASMVTSAVKENDVCIKDIDVKAESVCPSGTVDAGRFCETELTVDPEVSCPSGYVFEGEKCIKKKETILTLECPPGYELHSDKCQRLRVFNANEYCSNGFIFHQGVCVSYLKKPVMFSCDKNSQLTPQNTCVLVHTLEKQLKCPQGYVLDLQYNKSPVVGERTAVDKKESKAVVSDSEETEGYCVRRIETAAISTCPVDTVTRGSDCVRTETIVSADSCDPGFEFRQDTRSCTRKEIRQPAYVCPSTHKMVNKFCIKKKVNADMFKRLRN